MLRDDKKVIDNYSDVIEEHNITTDSYSLKTDSDSPLSLDTKSNIFYLSTNSIFLNNEDFISLIYFSFELIQNKKEYNEISKTLYLELDENFKDTIEGEEEKQNVDDDPILKLNIANHFYCLDQINKKKLKTNYHNQLVINEEIKFSGSLSYYFSILEDLTIDYILKK